MVESGMVKMLANLPEEQREKMMTQRLNLFSEMLEEQRVEGIKDMLLQIAELSEEERQKMMTTRKKVVRSFPEEKARVVSNAFKQASMKLPEEAKMILMASMEKMLGKKVDPMKAWEEIDFPQ